MMKVKPCATSQCNTEILIQLFTDEKSRGKFPRKTLGALKEEKKCRKSTGNAAAEGVTIRKRYKSQTSGYLEHGKQFIRLLGNTKKRQFHMTNKYFLTGKNFIPI